MSRHLFLLPLCAAILAFPGCKPSSDAEDEPPAPVATVQVEPLRRGDLEQTLTAYGSVVAEPGKSVGLSVPYEGTVTRTLVVPGQPVEANEPIMEIAASAATQLQVSQAHSSLQSAETDLKQVRQRYDLKLATNQELNQAQRALDDARLQSQSLEEHGATNVLLLKSPARGIVQTLGSQAGQTVAAGSTLAEIVAADAIEVRLGIEPDDLTALQVGGEVKLIPVNQPGTSPVTGTVRLLTASVNPTSRLVDVFVTLPKTSGFLLGGYVQADFAKRVHGAWVVPIRALLAAPEGTRLFAVQAGKAVEHKVEVGLQSHDRAVVRSPDLQADMNIVVDGNYELEDGMRVEVK